MLSTTEPMAVGQAIFRLALNRCWRFAPNRFTANSSGA
jgi:hypothetical protein